MASVYFIDADKVTHSLPSELTHFEPNDESDPYVLDKLIITYVSGRTRVQKVDKFYFQAIHDYIDETAQAFVPVMNYEWGKPAFIADFVRFIGSRKLVKVVVNMWIHGVFQGNLRRIFQGFLIDMLMTQELVSIRSYDIVTNNKHIIDNDPEHIHGPSQYLAVMLFIVDVCEHTRDTIDYVRTSTNKAYALPLRCLLDDINKLLAEVNPTKHVNTMKWLMKDFHKIPQRILDAWLATESS